MSVRKLKHYQEAVELHRQGLIGSGTLSTAKYAFEQGKPVYVGIPDGHNQEDADYLISQLELEE